MLRRWRRGPQPRRAGLPARTGGRGAPQLREMLRDIGGNSREESHAEKGGGGKRGEKPTLACSREVINVDELNFGKVCTIRMFSRMREKNEEKDCTRCSRASEVHTGIRERKEASQGRVGKTHRKRVACSALADQRRVGGSHRGVTA